jgi:hypothetical protein
MHKRPPRSLPRHTSRRRGTSALQRWHVPCNFRLLWRAAVPCRLHAQMAAAFFTASHFAAPRDPRHPALVLSLRIPPPLVGGRPLPPLCTNGRRVLYRVTLCGAESPAPSSTGAFLANSVSFGGRQSLAGFLAYIIFAPSSAKALRSPLVREMWAVMFWPRRRLRV